MKFSNEGISAINVLYDDLSTYLFEKMRTFLLFFSICVMSYRSRYTYI